MQVPLAETEDQGEAGQDDEGEGHDPGHAVVFVVAVAMGVIIMPVGVMAVGRLPPWAICPGTLL